MSDTPDAATSQRRIAARDPRSMRRIDWLPGVRRMGMVACRARHPRRGNTDAQVVL